MNCAAAASGGGAEKQGLNAFIKMVNMQFERRFLHSVWYA